MKQSFLRANSHHRIFGLDLMRAIAIMFVVCSHALWVFPEAQGAGVTLLRFVGIMGVEIFFVLSGFLIGRILLKTFASTDFKPIHWFYFLIRRWFRTLPNYYLVLLLNITVVYYLGQSLPESWPSYFVFLQNFNTDIPLFFTESWSLSIEEFAYIIGPLLLYVVCLPKLDISKEKLFLWTTVAIICFFILMKVYYNQTTNNVTLDAWNSGLKAVVVYRVDAIYYGVLAAYISMRRSDLWKKYTFSAFVLGVAGFLGFHYFIGANQWSPSSQPFLLNVLYFPIYSICIALTVPFFSRLKRAPKVVVRMVTFTSLISYSMYLLHYSIILVLLGYWFQPSTFTPTVQWIFAFGYVAVTMTLSYLLYRFYEKPMTNLRDLPIFKRPESNK